MYVLIHHKYKLKSDNIILLEGYETIINRQKITIMSQDLIDDYLKTKYMPALQRLLAKILRFLTDNDDDTDDDAGLLLDELARERAVLLNKYEKNLSKKAVKEYMKMISLFANELKIKYYENKKQEKTNKSLK
jgi:hypothetical protein